MPRNSISVSTKQERIAELAKQSPQMAFTSLAYLVDIDWLKEAYRRTRKDGAVGVDGVTAAEYEQDLEGNLQRLLDRAKSGTYHAPPVRRVHIPKGGSSTETRPIGIPTLEDKILQRAVVMLLEPIYEQDFLDCSYGFRPGRSAHQALAWLWEQTMDCQGGWILDVDVRKFFDNLDHGHLRAFLQLRVRDGVLLRLIGKWLKAGVMEDGSVSYPDTGSPQGGVVAPPTKVQNVLFAYFASFLRKKGEVDPVDDANLVALDQYAVDQRAKYLTTHQPISILQVRLDRFRKRVQTRQCFTQRRLFTRFSIQFRKLFCQLQQPLPSTRQSRIKFDAVQHTVGVGID